MPDESIGRIEHSCDMVFHNSYTITFTFFTFYEPTYCDEVAATCRHLACEEDRQEEVRLLVSAGADATLHNEVL